MKQGKTMKVSIDVKHLDPKFYTTKGIKQVIDPVIRGLKTGITVTNTGTFVYLKSEMQIIEGGKRKTIRQVWHNTKHDLPMESSELLKIKLKADQWYQDNKQKTDYKLIYLSEVIQQFFNDHEVTTGTQTNRRTALAPIMEHLQNIEVNDITSELLLSLQDVILNQPWKNVTKRSALNRFTQFIAYVFRVTKNKKVAAALTEFNLLKEKIRKSDGHFKTMESVTNQDLRQKLIMAIQSILSRNTKFKNEMIVLLLIPMRLSEVLSIKPENITPNNVFIEKTKTITAAQGGFNVPITETVHAFMNETDLKNIQRQTLSRIFRKRTGFTVHGIRSIFSDYMTREGFAWNLIESCLSHKTSNAVAECYHRDQKNYFYEQRKPLMQHWQEFVFDCLNEARKGLSQEESAPEK